MPLLGHVPAAKPMSTLEDPGAIIVICCLITRVRVRDLGFAADSFTQSVEVALHFF